MTTITNTITQFQESPKLSASHIKSTPFEMFQRSLCRLQEVDPQQSEAIAKWQRDWMSEIWSDEEAPFILARGYLDLLPRITSESIKNGIALEIICLIQDMLPLNQSAEKFIREVEGDDREFKILHEVEKQLPHQILRSANELNEKFSSDHQKHKIALCSHIESEKSHLQTLHVAISSTMLEMHKTSHLLEIATELAKNHLEREQELEFNLFTHLEHLEKSS